MSFPVVYRRIPSEQELSLDCHRRGVALNTYTNPSIKIAPVALFAEKPSIAMCLCGWLKRRGIGVACIGNPSPQLSGPRFPVP